MVNAQARLLDSLGVETDAAIGESMSGMQVLEWAATPATHRHSDCHGTRSFGAEYRLSRGWPPWPLADPAWYGGNYFEHETHPERGLSITRMVAHITYYLSLATDEI